MSNTQNRHKMIFVVVICFVVFFVCFFFTILLCRVVSNKHKQNYH